MKNIVSRAQGFLNSVKKNESGATAIEYVLIVAGIALLILAGIAIIGPQLSETFNSIGTALKG